MKPHGLVNMHENKYGATYGKWSVLQLTIVDLTRFSEAIRMRKMWDYGVFTL